ncbi:MAG: hypothetical protein ABIJ09_02320 [Pseudomonadota bacterium]
MVPVVRSTVLAVVAVILAVPAQAYRFSDGLEAYAYAQVWATVYEQLEEADALHQFPSGDLGVTETTGLSVHQVRAGLDYLLIDDRVGLHVQLKLERNPALLNAFASFHVARCLRVQVGQQKIPTTYEGLVLSRDLDFAHRSQLTRVSADYALSRGVHTSSLFYGNRSYYRDLGVALKGDVDLGHGGFRYFAMAGNGLGANLYIGGSSERQYILTNGPQLFYGLRLELYDWFDVVTVGAHASLNKHDNMVFNSGRVVYDLDRLSYSADLRLRIPVLGLRLAGLAGGGRIDDDYDNDGRADLLYEGWDLRLLWSVRDSLGTLLPASLTADHDLQLAARYDWYQSQWNEVGSLVSQQEITVGVNYLYKDLVRLMLDAIWRQTDEPGLPDLADDGVLLSLQISI